jgi:hypothetical protein
MQWIGIMLVGFLIVGLRRSSNRGSSVAVVAISAVVLIVWFTQMSPR